LSFIAFILCYRKKALDFAPGAVIAHWAWYSPPGHGKLILSGTAKRFSSEKLGMCSYSQKLQRILFYPVNDQKVSADMKLPRIPVFACQIVIFGLSRQLLPVEKQRNEHKKFCRIARIQLRLFQIFRKGFVDGEVKHRLPF
jgi:hypothetical protein